LLSNFLVHRQVCLINTQMQQCDAFVFCTTDSGPQKFFLTFTSQQVDFVNSVSYGDSYTTTMTQCIDKM